MPIMKGLIDITKKPEVQRSAVATGIIRLRNSTIEAIRKEQVKKGDALTIARIAAVLAVKETPRLITMCHPISITHIDVDFELEINTIKTTVTVSSIGKTGVEMEALTGVTASLLNIWDMVKYLEKDETGNYPETRIEEIRVLEKKKGNA
jgi:cyclic pyranopterin phosphate synthase